MDLHLTWSIVLDIPLRMPGATRKPIMDDMRVIRDERARQNFIELESGQVQVRGEVFKSKTISLSQIYLAATRGYELEGVTSLLVFLEHDSECPRKTASRHLAKYIGLPQDVAMSRMLVGMKQDALTVRGLLRQGNQCSLHIEGHGGPGLEFIAPTRHASGTNLNFLQISELIQIMCGEANSEARLSIHLDCCHGGEPAGDEKPSIVERIARNLIDRQQIPPMECVISGRWFLVYNAELGTHGSSIAPDSTVVKAKVDELSDNLRAIWPPYLEALESKLKQEPNKEQSKALSRYIDTTNNLLIECCMLIENFVLPMNFKTRINIQTRTGEVQRNGVLRYDYIDYTRGARFPGIAMPVERSVQIRNYELGYIWTHALIRKLSLRIKSSMDEGRALSILRICFELFYSLRSVINAMNTKKIPISRADLSFLWEKTVNELPPSDWVGGFRSDREYLIIVGIESLGEIVLK